MQRYESNFAVQGTRIASGSRAEDPEGTVMMLGAGMRRMKDLRFYVGGAKAQDGIVLDPANPLAANGIEFENVIFENCKRGVYKPLGNINNTFIECEWQGNVIGYCAIGSNATHPGADTFIRGTMRGNEQAAR